MSAERFIPTTHKESAGGMPKKGVIFERSKIGAVVEYGGLGVALWQLIKLNPVGVLTGLGVWVGGRWIRYSGKQQ